MKVAWDDKEFDFDLDELTVAQAKVIKVHCQLTLTKLLEGLREVDPDAVRAAFWLMHAQSGVPCNIDLVDFKLVDFANALSEGRQREREAAGETEPEAEEGPKEQ
jgi:hypothetical protein